MTNIELRIALYRGSPDSNQDDHQTFKEKVVSDFKKVRPDINLQVYLGNGIDTTDMAYIEQIFYEGFDAAEVDGLNTDYLVKKGLLEPVMDHQEIDDPDVHREAKAAFTVDNTLYAYPTGLCSCFLFSREKDITQSTNLQKSLALLSQKNAVVPSMLGSFFGMTVIPVYYGLFYIGMYGQESVHRAMEFPLDPNVLSVMKHALADAIQYAFKDSPHTIYDFSHENPYWAIDDYIQQKAQSVMAFGENIHHLLAHGETDSIHIAPAVFGDKEKTYVLFANGIVTNALYCSPERKQAVADFAYYLRSNKTMKWRTFSEDAPNTIPRYLLSPLKSFYEQEEIKRDPHFQTFKQVVDSGIAFTNRGYNTNREEMARQINEYMQDIMPK